MPNAAVQLILFVVLAFAGQIVMTRLLRRLRAQRLDLGPAEKARLGFWDRRSAHPASYTPEGRRLLRIYKVLSWASAVLFAAWLYHFIYTHAAR